MEENENFIHNKFGYVYYVVNDPGWIYNLYVYKAYRRKGYSKFFISYAINEIRKKYPEAIVKIEVKPRENSISKGKLIEYYKKMGLTIYNSDG